jgi:hypothetical protein
MKTSLENNQINVLLVFFCVLLATVIWSSSVVYKRYQVHQQQLENKVFVGHTQK